MKKAIIKQTRTILGIILFLCMIFFSFKLFSFYKINKVDSVERFSESSVVYGNEICYVNGEYIYLVNTTNGTLHIFRKNGDFECGFLIPTNGGDVWVGVSDKLYVYSVRKELLIEISPKNNVSVSEIFYNNQESFYNDLNLDNKNAIPIKKNIVTLYEDNKEAKIKLDVKSSLLSFDICMLLFVTCFVLFIVVTGLFEKMSTGKMLE